MPRLLIKGNEAMAEAAIRAGCRAYFGYPITPSSEVIEYMARRLPEVGGVMVQAESEISAINMVFGAAAAGARALTATSGPGMSLMQEGLSFMAANRLPGVILNVARNGPGLGGINPAQSDYFQATRGGGHGDYRQIVLAPSTVQEAADLMMEAFDLADAYRMTAIVLADGILGQMMEPVEFCAAPAGDALARDARKRELPGKDWAATGSRGGPRHVIHTYAMEAAVGEAQLLALETVYRQVQAVEPRWEEYRAADAHLLVVAYGTCGRIARTAVDMARATGVKVGLLRPITLWPFPQHPFEVFTERVRGMLVAEMSMGQFVEDVRLAVDGRVPVWLLRRMGGAVPAAAEIAERLGLLAGEVLA